MVKSGYAIFKARLLVPVGLLGVLIGGCAQTGSEATTSTAEPATTVVVATTTTTLAGSTTTVVSSTTPTVDGVTVDPNLPPAFSRGEVPWADVGSGWYVVLYDSSKAYPASESDVREGPIVLYLVNSAGERYEVGAWEAGQYATLIDATETSAVVARFELDLDQTVYEVVDLTTGASSVVHTIGFPESSLDIWPHVALTRPSGANVVVHRSDGTTEWLERRTPSGAILSVIHEQTYVEGGRSMAWLYGPDGTSLVVAGSSGISELSNEGSVLAELWAPADTHCDPVRWWDADTFLAACYGQGPGSAPLDDSGQPHTYYGRLWLLEIDGSAGIPLTDHPDEPPIVVDFGYHDAWPTDDDIFLEWSGDCGSSAVATLNGEGTGDFMDIEEPEPRLAHGVEMVDIVGEQMTIYGWESCDAAVGGLFAVDLEGGYLTTLVPVIGDSRGVTGVRGLATVYP